MSLKGRYAELSIATPMHSAQLCAVHEQVGSPHEEGDLDSNTAALHSFRPSMVGAHGHVAENDGPADIGHGAGILGKAVWAEVLKNASYPNARCDVRADVPKLCVASGPECRGVQPSSYA